MSRINRRHSARLLPKRTLRHRGNGRNGIVSFAEIAAGTKVTEGMARLKKRISTSNVHKPFISMHDLKKRQLLSYNLYLNVICCICI